MDSMLIMVLILLCVFATIHLYSERSILTSSKLKIYPETEEEDETIDAEDISPEE